MLDLDDMKRKAEKATPGPWAPYCDYQWNLDWLCNDKDHASVSVRDTDGQPERTICEFRVAREDEEGNTISPKDMAQTAANIEFIAAANPRTVLALIAEIERLKTDNAEYAKRAVCDGCGKKEGAELTVCPYAQEIHNDTEPMVLCSDCHRERAMDI